MIYKFFDKKSSGSRFKSEIMSNRELAEKLHKPIIKKSGKRKVYLPFKEGIWGGDCADLQLTSKVNKNEEVRFLLCIVDIYSKYALFVPLKDKRRYYNY